MADPKLQATLSAVDRFSRVVRRANDSLRPLKIRAEETQRAFRRLSRETGMGQLIQTLGRAAGPMRRLGAAARSAAGPLGVITGGGVVLGLASMTTGYARATDEAAKFARETGTSVQALESLRFAAGREGASVADLNIGLRTLRRTLGEARIGTGELNSFLEATSPALLKALKSTTDTEEAFLLLSQAIASSEDGFLATKLAAAALGESGQKLLNLLGTGPENIRGLQDEYARLHGEVSAQAAAAAEQFMDAMGNLQAATKGVRTVIGEELLPALTPLIKDMTEWIVANRELIGQKVSGFVTQLADVLSKVDFETVRIGAAALGAVMAGPLIAGIGGIISGFAILASVLVANPILAILAGLAVAAVAIARNWDELGEVFGPFVDRMSEELAPGIAIARDFAEKIGGALSGIADEAFSVGESAGASFAKLWLSMQKGSAARDSIDAFIDGSLKRLKTVADDILAFWQPVADFFERLWGIIDSVGVSAKQALKDLRNSSVGQTIEDVNNRFGAAVSEVASFLGFGDDREARYPEAGRPGAVQGQGGVVEVRFSGELPPNTRMSTRSQGAVRTDVETDDQFANTQ